MKHPHRRLILALIIDRLPAPEIRKFCWSLGLALPSKQELLDFEAEVVDAADPSLHKYLCNPKIQKTKNKLKPLGELVFKLKVQAYFDVRISLDRLFRVLQTREVRAAVEGLCLTTMSLEEIVTLVNRRWGHSLLKEDLENYKILFWDTTEMDLESWGLHLSGCDAKAAAIKSFALSNPDEHEKVKWLCDLPVSLEYTTLLQKVMTDAFFHTQKAFASSFPDVGAIKGFSSVMTNTGDRLKKWGGERKGDEVAKAIRVLAGNRESGNVPRAARVISGAMPKIEPQGQLVVLPPQKKAP